MISRNKPIYPATSLNEAQSKGISVCVARGFGTDTKLSRAYPNVKYVRSEGLTAMYEDLRDGKCGLVATSAARFEIEKVDHALNPDCLLEWVGRAVDISSAGPANAVDAGIYCTSLVGHVFEYYMKEMQHNGFIENAFENYVKSITTHQCPEQEETSSDTEETISLTMVDMGGVFLVHGVACVVGLLVSILQRCCGTKRSDRGRMHNDENVEVVDQKVNEESGGNAIITARQLGSGGY